VSEEVLEGLLPDEYLQHWRLFTRAYRILVQEEITGHEIDYAELLLQIFYDGVQDIYDGSLCTIKVHQIIHAATVVRNFGPLPNVSSYKFEDMNGKIVERNKAKKLPVDQLHTKVQQMFFLPSILFSLRDASGDIVCENHPFVQYLEEKIGYVATTTKHLPKFWKFMPFDCKQYTYREANTKIEEITNRCVHDLLESANIDPMAASFFECFNIGKMEFQIARRGRFTHNSSWVQFKRNNNLFCGRLQEAFYVCDNFQVVVESIEAEFLGHRLQCPVDVETTLLLVPIRNIVDQCVYVRTEETFSLFPQHSKGFEVPKRFTRCDDMEYVDESYSDDEEYEKLRTTLQHRHEREKK
jgi:hypothetical protein